MKKVVLFILIFCNLISNSYSSNKMSIVDIFPKSSELPGGSSTWIISEIEVDNKSKCTLYTRNYTYYSDKAEKILDIQRNNTYNISIRLYSCNNFINAIELYNKYSDINIKKANKGKLSSVPFGEKGTLLALPIKDETVMADFYLNFLMRSFVVQVYSNDGFALMDMAGFIYNKLTQFITSGNISYYINKINLKSEVDNIVYKDTLTFNTDNISQVIIKGTVFDSNNLPVPDVKITALETNQSTKSDNKGNYTIKVSAGKGNSITLNKTIFIPKPILKNKQHLKSNLYILNTSMKKQTKEEILDILLIDNKIIGKILDSKGNEYPINGSISNDEIKFIRNCTPKGAVFECRQVYKGKIEDSIYKGSWQGTGGSGKWSFNIESFRTETESKYPINVGLNYGNFIKVNNDFNKINKYTDDIVLSNKNTPTYLLLEFNDTKEDKIFIKKVLLNIEAIKTDIKDSDEVYLVLYKLVKNSNNIIISKKFIRNITQISLDKKVYNIDISSEYRSNEPVSYLIGIESKSKNKSIVLNIGKVDIDYYERADKVKDKESLSAKILSDSSEDIVSNSNNIKMDGENDIELEMILNNNGTNLEYIEIIADSGIIRKWNTNPYDIYPSIAIFKDNSLLNENDGSINYKIDKGKNKFTLYIYKGSLSLKDTKDIRINIIIDSKKYEGKVTFKKK